MRRLSLAAALVVAGCATPDPQALLEVRGVETYWTVDPSRGTTNYLAPAVRFEVVNRTAEPTRSIQATATFRRTNEPHLTWGSAWEQVTPAGQPLAPGESRLVLLKSDARYFSEGPPESFFAHEQFQDVKVEVFLRVGSSGWSQFSVVDVERRLGSRSVEPITSAPPDPELPTPPPR